MALVKAFMHVEWALVSDSYHDLLVLFPFHFKMNFISETKSIEFQYYIRNMKWPVFLEVCYDLLVLSKIYQKTFQRSQIIKY